MGLAHRVPLFHRNLGDDAPSLFVCDNADPSLISNASCTKGTTNVHCSKPSILNEPLGFFALTHGIKHLKRLSRHDSPARHTRYGHPRASIDPTICPGNPHPSPPLELAGHSATPHENHHSFVFSKKISRRRAALLGLGTCKRVLI